MSRSRNRCKVRRRQLLAEHPYCFYCGLGFPTEGVAAPAQEAPGWDQLWLRARPTLEHLHPRSQGGTTARDNTVLAHSWCNSLAAARPVQEKLRLREEMREAVRVLRGATAGWRLAVAEEEEIAGGVGVGGELLRHRETVKLEVRASSAGVERHLVIDGLLRLAVVSVQVRPAGQAAEPGESGYADFTSTPVLTAGSTSLETAEGVCGPHGPRPRTPFAPWRSD